LLLVLLAAGCKADKAVQKGELIDRGTKHETPPGPIAAWSPTGGTATTTPDTGQVVGVISFSGKPPERIRIDTTMDPACVSPGQAPVLTEQYVVNAGKLANVFIFLKSGPPAAMNATVPNPRAVVLDQRGCQYVPHVLGVVQGGFVEFRNADPTMHNVHTMPTAVGNETIDVSMGPKGTPVTRQFDKPEFMIPVRCNNHPWMNAFINVSATPYFAVSDAQGRFILRGLPPGDYVLGALHEKLGEQDVAVTVKANANTDTDLVFSQK
jgi:plastocyanin